MSFISAKDCIFLRNYSNKETMRIINLNFMPQCFTLSNFAEVASEMNFGGKTQKDNVQILLAIGGQNGQVSIQLVDLHGKNKMICCTKAGMNFGAITSVCFGDKSLWLVTGSESGEVMNYSLQDKYDILRS